MVSAGSVRSAWWIAKWEVMRRLSWKTLEKCDCNGKPYNVNSKFVHSSQQCSWRPGVCHECKVHA